MEAKNMKTCTQCHKGCPIDALKCGRGKAYFSKEYEQSECKQGHSRHEYQENDLAHLLMRCGHIVTHKGKKKRGQIRILQILSEFPDISQKELQEKLGIEAGSLSEIINKLESRELIKREKDPEDKRRMRISLTDRGYEKLKEKLQKKEDHEEKLFGMLNEEEKENLRLILTKIIHQWHEEHHKRGMHHGHCHEGRRHGKGHRHEDE